MVTDCPNTFGEREPLSARCEAVPPFEIHGLFVTKSDPHPSPLPEGEGIRREGPPPLLIPLPIQKTLLEETFTPSNGETQSDPLPLWGRARACPGPIPGERVLSRTEASSTFSSGTPFDKLRNRRPHRRRATRRGESQHPPQTRSGAGRKDDSKGNYLLEDPTRSSFPRKRESRRWIPASAEPAPGLNGGMMRKTCLRDRLAYNSHFFRDDPASVSTLRQARGLRTTGWTLSLRRLERVERPR